MPPFKVTVRKDESIIQKIRLYVKLIGSPDSAFDFKKQYIYNNIFGIENKKIYNLKIFNDTYIQT